MAPSMRRVVAAFVPRLQPCSSRPLVSDTRCNLIRATMTSGSIPVLDGHLLRIPAIAMPFAVSVACERHGAAGRNAATQPQEDRWALPNGARPHGKVGTSNGRGCGGPHATSPAAARCSGRHLRLPRPPFKCSRGRPRSALPRLPRLPRPHSSAVAAGTHEISHATQRPALKPQPALPRPPSPPIQVQAAPVLRYQAPPAAGRGSHA